jgi:RND superfamily putative drug exporter
MRPDYACAPEAGSARHTSPVSDPGRDLTSRPTLGTQPPATRRSARRGRGGRRRTLLRVTALTLVLLAWAGISGVGGPLIGRLSQVQQNDNSNFLPKGAESARLAVLSARFASSTALPYFVVVERTSGLTAADRAGAAALAARVPDLQLTVNPAQAGGRTFTVGQYLAPGAIAGVPSQDGQALLLPVQLDTRKASGTLPDGTSVLLKVAQALRAASSDLKATRAGVYVTGPGGLLADLVTAFGGIDGKLLLVSLVAVFVILLLVYRSPLLPLAALLTAAFGLSLAALVIYPLADRHTITLDGQSQGILSILVIGAATDYALLLVSRYREELHDHASKYVAMRRAWRAAVEPIVASAATVILGLLCLLLSSLGSTRGLGPVGAFGIAGALLSALTLLPVLLLWPIVLLTGVLAGIAFALGSVLVGPTLGGPLALAVVVAVGVLGVLRRRVLSAVGVPSGQALSRDGAAGLPWFARAASGRWLFWPRTPRIDHVHSADALGGNGIWGRIAGLVGRRPRVVWVSTLLVLLAAAAFAPTFAAQGVSTSQTFRTEVESVTGQDVLVKHFPGGSGNPAVLVVQEADVAQTLSVARGVPGVSAATVAAVPGTASATSPGTPKVVDGMVQVEVTLGSAADSPAAEATVERLRTAVDVVGSDVLVGGTTATDLDVRDASRRDLVVVIPAILVVILMVLMLLLRAVVAPLLLVAANVLSFGATIGVSALVFGHVLDFPGGSPSIPLYGFVFLVALGIDYSIFLMTRVREEAVHRGPRQGVLVGLAVTGGVITSAGVVLAATFGALSTIPILFLQQIAFIVAFGVLLDTLVVRSLLVPAISVDLGRRVWWPSRLSHRVSQAQVSESDGLRDDPVKV